MVEEQMSLEDKLRNPAWDHEPGQPPRLNVEQTRSTTAEALARIILDSQEEERLRAEIDQLRGKGFGWLIETGDNKYWNGKHANADGFTHDPNDAVRFARFEDSERIIYWLMESYKVFLVSRQHKWIDGVASTDGQ